MSSSPDRSAAVSVVMLGVAGFLCVTGCAVAAVVLLGLPVGPAALVLDVAAAAVVLWSALYACLGLALARGGRSLAGPAALVGLALIPWLTVFFG